MKKFLSIILLISLLFVVPSTSVLAVGNDISVEIEIQILKIKIKILELQIQKLLVMIQEVQNIAQEQVLKEEQQKSIIQEEHDIVQKETNTQEYNCNHFIGRWVCNSIGECFCYKEKSKVPIVQP